MQDIDERIRQALSQEDQSEIEQLENGTGLFELIGMSFQGKQAWMMYYMYIFGFVVVAVLVYFTFQYFASSDIKTSLSWGLGIITCLIMIALVKIIAWQQMLKLELLREMKRLEMRLMLAHQD